VVSSSGEEYTGESAAVEEPLRVQLQPRHIGSGLHDWLVKGAAFYRTCHYHFSVDMMHQGIV
jgi:hypothetical protein